MSNRKATASKRVEPEEFFQPWESTITSWQSANELIEAIIRKAGKKRVLAWRGVSNANYTLYSSLYRRLHDKLGEAPDEKKLSEMEEKILDKARRFWRFDNLSALEIMAHIQHYGGPTRLIDVSLNPMIALWFAVESQCGIEGREDSATDARIYVFDVTNRNISLDSKWKTYDLPWKNYRSAEWRNGELKFDWCKDLPVLWRPPSYNDRIPAQNSAFLVGGVPKMGPGTNAYLRKAPGNGVSAGTWSIDEVKSVTSVTLRMNSLDSSIRGDDKPLTYTLRISADAKQEIRERLEKSYGYNVSSIYPDLFGLATHGVKGLL